MVWVGASYLEDLTKKNIDKGDNIRIGATFNYNVVIGQLINYIWKIGKVVGSINKLLALNKSLNFQLC